VVNVRNDGDVTNLVHGTILEIEEREYGGGTPLRQLPGRSNDQQR
jgi:hypothetical protein